MTPMPPLFVAFFFAIFHAFGGVAFGRGLRTILSDPGNAAILLLWGTLLGLTPLIFDWFFLLREGQLLYGLIGPAVFVVAALASASLWTGAFEQLDSRALSAVALGGAAFLIGIAAVPYLVRAAQASAATFGEVVFGGCWGLLFVGIGAGVAWTGLMALRHGRTFDQEARHRQQAAGRRRTKAREPKESDRQ